MPKIICTVTTDLTYDQRMIRICTSLVEMGYEVLLVGRERPSSIDLDQKKYQQHRIKCWNSKGKLFYLEYNLRLFWFLLFAKFDAICSVDLDTILPGFYVARWRKKTCIYDAHEYFSELPEVTNRPKVQRIWKRIEALTIPRLKYCYTVGQGIAEIFEKQYGTSFEVIRNVPFGKNNSNIIAEELSKSEEKIILYQGALNDGRGLETVILAMEEIDNAKLWLAGEGDLSEELRNLAKEIKVTHKVRFLGYIKPKDLTQLTEKAYIGLNLLENKGLNYYYSLANKTFDYIQANVPAIHMNFPEYTTINAAYKVAILIDDLQVETVVDALKELLENEKLYQELQANCEKASPIFVWEKESEKLKSFYAKAVPL